MGLLAFLLLFLGDFLSAQIDLWRVTDASFPCLSGGEQEISLNLIGYSFVFLLVALVSYLCPSGLLIGNYHFMLSTLVFFPLCQGFVAGILVCPVIFIVFIIGNKFFFSKALVVEARVSSLLSLGMLCALGVLFSYYVLLLLPLIFVSLRTCSVLMLKGVIAFVLGFLAMMGLVLTLADLSGHFLLLTEYLGANLEILISSFLNYRGFRLWELVVLIAMFPFALWGQLLIDKALSVSNEQRMFYSLLRNQGLYCVLIVILFPLALPSFFLLFAFVLAAFAEPVFVLNSRRYVKVLGTVFFALLLMSSFQWLA